MNRMAQSLEQRTKKPVLVNGYVEICPLAKQGCEKAKDKKNFESTCSRNYEICLLYQIDKMFGSGFYESK